MRVVRAAIEDESEGKKEVAEGGRAGPGAVRKVEGLKGVLAAVPVMMDGMVSRLLPSSARVGASGIRCQCLSSAVAPLPTAPQPPATGGKSSDRRNAGWERERRESGTHSTGRPLRLPSRLSGWLRRPASYTRRAGEC